MNVVDTTSPVLTLQGSDLQNVDLISVYFSDKLSEYFLEIEFKEFSLDKNSFLRFVVTVETK